MITGYWLHRVISYHFHWCDTSLEPCTSVIAARTLLFVNQAPTACLSRKYLIFEWVLTPCSFCKDRVYIIGCISSTSHLGIIPILRILSKFWSKPPETYHAWKLKLKENKKTFGKTRPKGVRWLKPERRLTGKPVTFVRKLLTSAKIIYNNGWRYVVLIFVCLCLLLASLVIIEQVYKMASQSRALEAKV